MLNQNIEESKIIKEEMSSIKRCITTYMSYIIGSSGISFVFVTFVNRAEDNHGFRLFLILGACFIITAIYYLLLYKYTSHNRYSGYLRLITQEVRLSKTNSKKTVNETKTASQILQTNKELPDNLIVWELIMSKLLNTKRTTSFPRKYWTHQLRFLFQTKDTDVSIAELFGTNKEQFKNLWYGYNLIDPEKDRHSFFNGLRLIFNGFFKSRSSGSWNYPLYTSYIVIVLYAVMQVVGLYSFLVVVKHDIDKPSMDYLGELKFIFETCGYVFAQFILLLVWIKNISELFKIMDGSKTIDAYCWKFLQFRIEILNGYGYLPIYQLTNRNMKFPKEPSSQ